MKIVKFEAENFQILRSVEITPEGHIVEIGGKNGQGKSSVLDAIWVALAGVAAAPPKPIRKGEEECRLHLDLGELVISRKFTQKEDGRFTHSVKVENQDGLRYSRPQEVLAELLGEIGFDPFAFTRLKPQDQAERLLQLVPLPIDLDDMAKADSSDYAKRTEANRVVKSTRAQRDAIQLEEELPPLIDRDKVADDLSSAADTNSQIAEEARRREEAACDIEATRNQAEMARQSAERLRREAEEQEELAKARDGEADAKQKALEALEPVQEQIDTAALRQKLSEADGIKARHDAQARRRELTEQLERAEAESQGYTEAMEAREREREAALAEAQMPIEGLSFAINEQGKPTVQYQGVPFEQASTADQLRASTAIGMAANPELRVLRIKDGSLLDEDSMAQIAQMAEEEDFQLWIEVVGEGGVGIIMEDGTVRGQGDAKSNPDADPEPEQKELV